MSSSMDRGRFGSVRWWVCGSKFWELGNSRRRAGPTCCRPSHSGGADAGRASVLAWMPSRAGSSMPSRRSGDKPHPSGVITAIPHPKPPVGNHQQSGPVAFESHDSGERIQGKAESRKHRESRERHDIARPLRLLALSCPSVSRIRQRLGYLSPERVESLQTPTIASK